MKFTDKNLWVVFVTTLWSPILALVLKPSGYSFYMFTPATPHSTLEQVLLLAANLMLVLGFAFGLLAALTLTWRGLRSKRYLRLSCLVVILAHPIYQPIYLTSLDTYLVYRWRDRAELLHLVGMTPAEVRTLMGKPSSERTSTSGIHDTGGKVTRHGESYICWAYKPLPFYFVGGKLRVFFFDGKVRNFNVDN